MSDGKRLSRGNAHCFVPGNEMDAAELISRDIIASNTVLRDFHDHVSIESVMRAEQGTPTTVYRPRACQPCSYPVTSDIGRTRYCDAPGLPGKSYCATHHAVTHRKPRKG